MQDLSTNDFIVTIHTQNIVYIALEDGTATYTMAATTNIENDLALTNIIYFLDEDEALDYKVIRYLPDDNWLEAYQTNPNILFQGTIEGYGSEEVDLSNANVAARNGDVEMCPIGIEPIWICNANNEHYPGHPNCREGGNRIIGYRLLWEPCPTFSLPNGTGVDADGYGVLNPDGTIYTGPSTGNDVVLPLLLPTKPLTVITTEQLILNLGPEIAYWWNQPENSALKDQITAYIVAENHSQEAIDEIKNIINLLDDGLINGQEVFVGPDLPINNMSEYLSGFDLSQPAVLTIYADQPKAGEHYLISTEDSVGHAFISIKQGDKVRTLGFYPQSSIGSAIPNPLTLDPTDFLPTQGIFGNDQGHAYDVSLSVPITSAGLTNLISNIITFADSEPLYNLGSSNCTDLAIVMFESQTGVEIPNCESPTPWNGQTPGTLGEVIRNMPTPLGGTINTMGGNAPSNN